MGHSRAGTEMAEPTLQQWKRRALKAEAELASIRDMRSFEHELEMQHHRELAIYKTALKEAQEAINWALEQQT